jgi:hypothetical protein
MSKFIGQSDIKHIMTSSTKTIAWVLKAFDRLYQTNWDIRDNICFDIWRPLTDSIRLTEISEIMSVLTSEGLWQTLSDWDIRDNICFDILKLFYIYHISSYTAFISLSRIIQNDSFIKDFTLQYTSSNCKYTKQKFISWILTYLLTLVLAMPHGT